MGLRYQAILKSLNVDYYPFDIHSETIDLHEFTHFIIATPTYTHLKFISNLAPFNRPILCEKPIVHSFTELKDLLEKYPDLDIQMMMQYVYLKGTETDGNDRTEYDYFRTGNDGLYWDCLQPIALHDNYFKKLKINNQSPIWKCSINGKTMSLADMDLAYCIFVEQWLLGKRLFSKSQLIDIHQKVERYIDYVEDNDRNTSEINQHALTGEDF